MHIYGSTVSPFVQRALMTARAKGHELEVQLPPGGMQSEEFLAVSPMGRIPVLALDDSRHICESEAIAGYLDETLPGPSLLPADPVERARVREITSLTLAEVAGGARPLMVHLVFRMAESADIVAGARAQLDKGLGAIEAVRGVSGRLAIGDTTTAADCVLVPVLTLLTIIDGPADTAKLIAARPGLAAYYDRAKVDPVVGRSVTEMVDGFAAMMARRAAPAAA